MKHDLPGPDIIDELLTHHGRAEELFKEVLHSEGGERRGAFHDLVRLLSIHETIEEQLVHPLTRSSIDAGAAMVEDRLREEHDAKEMLKDLYERGPDDPEFEQRLLVLRDAVLEHATYEERYEFPRLRQANSPRALKALVPLARAAEAVVPTRPHPGVESATANLLAGPFAAISDRIRDALRNAREKD
jgi:iron-sulfur cluster repair protein YtfE (RIC family)